MTSNIMKSQLSRLYGQLYAFQVRVHVIVSVCAFVFKCVPGQDEGAHHDQKHHEVKAQVGALHCMLSGLILLVFSVSFVSAGLAV